MQRPAGTRTLPVHSSLFTGSRATRGTRTLPDNPSLFTLHWERSDPPPPDNPSLFTLHWERSDPPLPDNPSLFTGSRATRGTRTLPDDLNSSLFTGSASRSL